MGLGGTPPLRLGSSLWAITAGSQRTLGARLRFLGMGLGFVEQVHVFVPGANHSLSSLRSRVPLGGGARCPFVAFDL